MKEEKNVDLKTEMGEFIRKLFRSLIRKYGNSKFKVCSLLNFDLDKWQKKLFKKDNREPEIKLRAIVMFGRYVGWRGEDFELHETQESKGQKNGRNGNVSIVSNIPQMVRISSNMPSILRH